MTRKIRISIAGLMGLVLVAAIGFAALHNASEAWAGVMLLLTCGVLTLAVIGAICRGPDERARWLGLALFGWGYLALAHWFSFYEGTLPTITLAEVIGSQLDVTLDSSTRGLGEGWNSLSPSYRILHCLWALSLALLGCLLAGALVTLPGFRGAEPGSPSPRDREPSRVCWRRPATAGLSGFGLAAVAALAGRWAAPGIWAGVTFLLTCGLLGLAALGAVFRRGRDRETWLGAALFGFGYLLLTFGWFHERSPDRFPSPRLPTDQLLNAIFRPGDLPAVGAVPDSEVRIGVANRRILGKLEQPIPLHFRNETPLDQVLGYIKKVTQDPVYYGIPIYVDPIGLKKAARDMNSPVCIDFEAIPVKDALRLCLKQLGLTFGVRSGYVIITSEDDPSVPVYDDPMLIVGHCLLALIAAGLGGVAAPLVSDLRLRPTTA